MIEDTNSPFLLQVLAQLGYRAESRGSIMRMTPASLPTKLSDAAERGFGLVITTGGVGAEAKDCSVEALTNVDPQAATPWIVKFRPALAVMSKTGFALASVNMD